MILLVSRVLQNHRIHLQQKPMTHSHIIKRLTYNRTFDSFPYNQLHIIIRDFQGIKILFINTKEMYKTGFLKIKTQILQTIFAELPQTAKKLKLTIKFDDEDKFNMFKRLQAQRKEDEKDYVELESSSEEQNEEAQAQNNPAKQSKGKEAVKRGVEDLMRYNKIQVSLQKSIIYKQFYERQFQKISEKHNVKIKIRAQKVTFQGHEIEEIQDCMDQINELMGQIEVRYIHKYGQEMEQSNKITEALDGAGVRILRILDKYYRWWEISQRLDSDDKRSRNSLVENTLKKIDSGHHCLQYLSQMQEGLQSHKGSQRTQFFKAKQKFRTYRPLLVQLKAKIFQDELKATINIQQQQEEIYVEVSKTQQALVFHSSVKEFLQMAIKEVKVQYQHYDYFFLTIDSDSPIEQAICLLRTYQFQRIMNQNNKERIINQKDKERMTNQKDKERIINQKYKERMTNQKDKERIINQKYKERMTNQKDKERMTNQKDKERMTNQKDKERMTNQKDKIDAQVQIQQAGEINYIHFATNYQKVKSKIQSKQQSPYFNAYQTHIQSVVFCIGFIRKVPQRRLEYLCQILEDLQSIWKGASYSISICQDKAQDVEAPNFSYQFNLNEKILTFTANQSTLKANTHILREFVINRKEKLRRLKQLNDQVQENNVSISIINASQQIQDSTYLHQKSMTQVMVGTQSILEAVKDQLNDNQKERADEEQQQKSLQFLKEYNVFIQETNKQYNQKYKEDDVSENIITITSKRNRAIQDQFPKYTNSNYQVYKIKLNPKHKIDQFYAPPGLGQIVTVFLPKRFSPFIKQKQLGLKIQEGYNQAFSVRLLGLSKQLICENGYLINVKKENIQVQGRGFKIKYGEKFQVAKELLLLSKK